MSVVSFSGLASGIDSASLIDKLVAAEKMQADQYTSQQTSLSSKKTAIDALVSSVSSLGSLAHDLALPSTLQMRAGTSSDSTISVTVSGTATPAVHDVRVEQTAVGQVAASRQFTSSGVGVLGAGSVQITMPGATTPGPTVSWTASDTLATIASKINDAKAGVNASVLYDGSHYQVVVTSQKTGAANAATFVETGDSLGLAANITVPARDAKVWLDGIEVTRSTNVIDDALPGVTLTVNSAPAASAPDTVVSVTNDSASLKAKLKSFVDAYNKVAGAISVQSTYNANASKQSALFGDSTLRSLQGAMQSLVGGTFGSMHLSDLGLSRDKDGMMTIDDTKLDTALQSNPNAIGDLFVTNGFAKALGAMSDLYGEAGDGVLVLKSKSLTDQSNVLQTQIDQIDSNADALKTRLEAQFSALEQAMSKLQSESSYISKIL